MMAVEIERGVALVYGWMWKLEGAGKDSVTFYGRVPRRSIWNIASYCKVINAKLWVLWKSRHVEQSIQSIETSSQPTAKFQIC